MERFGIQQVEVDRASMETTAVVNGSVADTSSVAVNQAPAVPEAAFAAMALAAPAAVPLTVSIREIIFNPPAFKDAPVRIVGSCVLLDLELGRMDVSGSGAKLIIQLGHIDAASRTFVEALTPRGADVEVIGRVKKQQRRTFLDASSVALATTSVVLQERN